MEIRRKTIFNSEKYSAVMYVSLIVVSLLILFSFINLVEQEDIIKKEITSPISTFVIQEQENVLNISYLAYYSLIIMLVALIFIVVGKLRYSRRLEE